MNITRLRAIAALTGLLGVCLPFATPLQAQPAATSTQAWPQRAVRFIVPFGPGAGADIGARLIQEKLSARWGKPVVIENRPGGDSIIAIQAVMSANDDHTFYWGPSGSFIVHPHLYQKLPYNIDDLLPIASFSATILSLAVPTAMNVQNLAGFVDRARAASGKFNAAAVPGITELAFDYFANRANLTFTKVPYRDIVQAVNDLAEDRLQVYTSSYAIQRPQREAGRIKVLAQLGRTRAPSLPDVPTGTEQGFPALGDGGAARPVRHQGNIAGTSGKDRRRHRCRLQRQGDRGEARCHRADSVGRWRESICGCDCRAARPGREHRQSVGHQAEAVNATVHVLPTVMPGLSDGHPRLSWV